MTTLHDPVNFTAGDTWDILVTCLDESDVPFDLSTAEVKWTLTHRHSGVQLISPLDCQIIITDAPAGKCTIRVPGGKTSKVMNGVHQDALRIVAGGVTSTLSLGSIIVLADPFKLPPAHVKATLTEAKDTIVAVGTVV